MITRIVKMQFAPEHVPTFLAMFDEVKEKIRAVDGCEHLTLYQDIHHPGTIFTYSYWQREEDLEAYRHSELFRTTWARTKQWFDGKPVAWSVNALHTLN